VRYLKKIANRMKKSFLNPNSFFKKIDGIFGANPIFVKGLAITPLIMGATTLKASVLITVTMGLIFIPIMIFARCFGKHIKPYYREIVFIVIGACIFPFASKVCDYIDENTVKYLGIYLPILIIDSMIIVKAEDYVNTSMGIFKSIVSIIYTFIGFAVPCLIIGLIREFFSYGTVWDYLVRDGSTFSAISKPFIGYILVGLMASVYQALRQYRKKQINIHGGGNNNE